MVTVCGTSDAEGRSTKREVIRECLRRMHDREVDISRPLMVGDRGYDVLSAAAEGVPTIHVLWGYGSPESRRRPSRPPTRPRLWHGYCCARANRKYPLSRPLPDWKP